jgi:hypothetical protein
MIVVMDYRNPAPFALLPARALRGNDRGRGYDGKIERQSNENCAYMDSRLRGNDKNVSF